MDSRGWAALYAVLYTVREPLTLADIAAALGVTKDNVSVAIRRLEELGRVRRQYQPGDRRVYFAPKADFWDIGRHFLQRRSQPTFAVSFQLVDESLKQAQTSDGDAAIAERVQALKNFYDVLDGLTSRLLAADPHDMARLVHQITGHKGPVIKKTEGVVIHATHSKSVASPPFSHDVGLARGHHRPFGGGGYRIYRLHVDGHVVYHNDDRGDHLPIAQCGSGDGSDRVDVHAARARGWTRSRLGVLSLPTYPRAIRGFWCRGHRILRLVLRTRLGACACGSGQPVGGALAITALPCPLAVGCAAFRSEV